MSRDTTAHLRRCPDPKIFLLALSLACLAGLALPGCQNPSAVTAPSPLPEQNPKNVLNRHIDMLKNLPTVRRVDPWQPPPFITDQTHPGLTISTRHYQIFTTLDDALILRQTPIFLESAFKSYAEMTASDIQPQNPLPMYLFKNRQQWEDFTREKTGHLAPLYLKIRSGAYCFEGLCVAYHLGRQSDFAILAHEGWHQFNSGLFNYRLPAWLDEGLATGFEASLWQNNRFVFLPKINGTRLIPLKNALIAGNLFSVNQLLHLDPGQVVVRDSQDASPTDDPDLTGPTQVYYAQVYALIRFLREENYGQRLASLKTLLNDARLGLWDIPDDLKEEASRRNAPITRHWNNQIGPWAFEHYLCPADDAFEKQYLDFCRKITFHVPLNPPSEK